MQSIDQLILSTWLVCLVWLFRLFPIYSISNIHIQFNRFDLVFSSSICLLVSFSKNFLIVYFLNFNRICGFITKLNELKEMQNRSSYLFHANVKSIQPNQDRWIILQRKNSLLLSSHLNSVFIATLFNLQLFSGMLNMKALLWHVIP